mgnify:FL=1
MKKKLRRFKRRLLGLKDYVEADGSIIPAPDLRWCGAEFKDNSFYLQSAEREAQRLVQSFGCNADSHVLDIGCGQGRLPIGLIRVLGTCHYTGLDVDWDSIHWCRKYIHHKHPSFRFKHINVQNERYHKNGEPLNRKFKFHVRDNALDIIYLYSVFSHMYENNMRIYLKDFARILKPGGHLFFTTFVEENVPNFTNNPDDYGYDKYSSSLHVVRYEKNYLFSILQEKGFSVDKFEHRAEANGQSAIYAKLAK